MLYNRGLIGAMLGVEGIRKAQEKFGKKPLTGEQVRWGLEHLDLDTARIKDLGFEGMMMPVKTSCVDHEGARTARIAQWDGGAWKVISDWYTADETVTEPIVREMAAKYAAEKGINPRDCSKEG
jgi:branched-chain amino acid transport system substrate-binding protein